MYVNSPVCVFLGPGSIVDSSTSARLDPLRAACHHDGGLRYGVHGDPGWIHHVRGTAAIFVCYI